MGGATILHTSHSAQMAGGEMSCLSQNADALADDNRRLQDMLHSALRREAEALRRVKHLSDLLSECRVRTPSSGQDSTNNGKWSRLEKRGDDWQNIWDRDDSIPHSQQSSDANLSPCLVVSPPFPISYDATSEEQTSALFTLPGAMSAPPLSTVLHRETLLDAPEIENTTDDIPAGLLAPALNTSGDVRRERERPPPSRLQRTPSPQPTIIDSYTQSQVSKEKRKSVTLGRISEVTISSATTRPRSHSILRPNWLRKKSGRRNSKTTTGAVTVTERFTYFTEHSSHISLHSFSKYIDQQWSEVCHGGGHCSMSLAKYRNAVWELFQSETKYLCNQLQPLEQVYKAFLEELQFYGLLTVAEIQKIFANLSELVELSISVATDLFKLFVGRRGDMIAPTNELILAFSMFGHKWNPVYQRFCVNKEQQKGFVKALQQLPDFQEYILVCRGHPIVHRSDLTDFLIAPMQHQCHYQLLLENVLKVTSEPSEKSLLTSAIKAFVVALKELQGNIIANQMSVELLELQETLSWPSLATFCPDSYIPENLSLEQQLCKDQLATPTRQMLHSGALCLIDNRGRRSNDIHLFLFTDMLLLTEPHKSSSRKETHGRELTRYRVYRQPLFLQWLEVHPLFSSHSPKYCFTIVERNGLHQLVVIYTFQTATIEDRNKWVFTIQTAQHSFCQSD